MQPGVRTTVLDSLSAQEKQPFLVLDIDPSPRFRRWKLQQFMFAIHIYISGESNLLLLRHFFGCRQKSSLWLWLTVRRIPSKGVESNTLPSICLEVSDGTTFIDLFHFSQAGEECGRPQEVQLFIKYLTAHLNLL